MPMASPPPTIGQSKKFSLHGGGASSWRPVHPDLHVRGEVRHLLPWTLHGVFLQSLESLGGEFRLLISFLVFLVKLKCRLYLRLYAI